MAESIAGKKVCSKCGADIRPGAVFCYSCGEAVTEGASNGKSATAETLFLDKNLPTDATAIEKPVGIPFEQTSVSPPTSEKKLQQRNKKLVVEKETNLKTAASLRKKNKPALKNSREVIWETPENSNQIWFIVVSLVLVVFAVLILLTMLYIG